MHARVRRAVARPCAYVRAPARFRWVCALELVGPSASERAVSGNGVRVLGWVLSQLSCGLQQRLGFLTTLRWDEARLSAGSWDRDVWPCRIDYRPVAPDETASRQNPRLHPSASAAPRRSPPSATAYRDLGLVSRRGFKPALPPSPGVLLVRARFRETQPAPRRGGDRQSSSTVRHGAGRANQDNGYRNRPQIGRGSRRSRASWVRRSVDPTLAQSHLRSETGGGAEIVTPVDMRGVVGRFARLPAGLGPRKTGIGWDALTCASFPAIPFP
jgi:hypothetical protein